MNPEPLISVLVPAYNAEAFLEQCLESIVAQTYRHLEIIVVDDGSTDSSGAISDRWAECDDRIRVIHQPNGGHSAARNTALDAMTGELVMMVDSDDVVHPEFAATLLAAMQRHDADIAVGSYIAFFGDKPDYPRNHNTAPRLYNQQQAIQAIFYQQGLTHSPWGRLFKASLFDGIRFPLGIIYEDLAIIYPLLKKCQRVVAIDDVLYGYRQHESNSMRVFSPRRSAVLDVCENLERQMQQEAPQYSGAVRSRLLSAYFNILLLSHQDKENDHQRLEDRCWQGIRRLRNDCLFNPNVRRKNKLGILASFLGRRFLCDVVGRNYEPAP
jgi:glycosyltransferase involved in cell wall biosynthesis